MAQAYSDGLRTTEVPLAAPEGSAKGLKSGALGLISSTVIGVASTAPAYSLAATLGFVVVAIGLQAPIVTVLAFIPMLFVAQAYNELNKADPDCGTTFTWATRAFGPRTGWWGGWGIVAADVLVMASLAQIAGQYVFLLFGANGIGSDASSGWVLLVGILWIVGMTYICYVGIEVSANLQKALLGIEITMLVILSVVALAKVGGGHGAPRPPGLLVVVAEPLRHPIRLGLHQRGPPHDLHLLGLGHGGLGQRGDPGPRQDARPGGADLHGPAARHLRPGRALHPVLRRRRDHRHRVGQPRPPGGRPVGAGQRHLRDVGPRGQCSPGCSS